VLRQPTMTKQGDYFVKLTFVKTTEVGAGRKSQFPHTIRLTR